MAFDTNKYRSIFEQRYGSGSYEKGMSNARDIGKLKVQAEFAKDEWTARQKAAEKAAKEAAKKSTKRTYQDAVNELKGSKIGDPSKLADEIRNNPYKQEQLKEQGYTVSEYIDGIFGAWSDGRYRSEREYKQSAADRNKRYKEQTGMPYEDNMKMLPKTEYAQAQEKKKKTTNKDNNVGILSDIGRAGKNFFQAVNPFDDVSLKEALKNNVDDALSTERGKGTKEATRGLTRIANTGTLGLLGEAYKRTNDGQRASQFTNENRGTLGKVADFGYDATGYLLPGLASANALRGTKLGADLTKTGFQKALQLGKEGAVTGLGMGAAEVGIREGMNPNDYSAKDNLSHIGLSTAIGGVGDPALYGIARMIKGGVNRLRGTNSITSNAAPTLEPLGLPEPQRLLNAPQMQLPKPQQVAPTFNNFQTAFNPPKGLNNPIPQTPKPLSQIMTQQKLQNQGLNFGFNAKNTPKPRPNLTPLEAPVDPLNRGQQYWQGRYEDFAKQINSSYDLNRLTPEALEDLWSSFAKYDEPVKLEQVVDLAYPKGFEAPNVPKTEPVVQSAPTLKDDLKADPRINELTRGLFPPVRPEPKISRRATFDEMAEQLRGLAPNKPPETPLQPLQFRRLAGGMEKQFTPSNSSNISGPSLNRLKAGRDFEAIEPAPRGKEGTKLVRVDDASQVEPLNLEELKSIKDISSPQTGTTDIYRLADRLPERQKTEIKTSLDTAKKSYVETQEKLTNDLYEKVVKGLGIKKGSKESALVQDYGEKTIVKRYLKKRGIDPKKLSDEELSKINLTQLKKSHPNDWQKIVAADDYFRQNYNKLIDEVNKVRKVIYPTSPDKIVPKRTDYYHHFNELEGFEGVKNLFDTPANIDPALEGLSPFTKPKTKFQGFMQQRGNGKYKSDAVGGYLKYVKASSHSINVDPVIPVLRSTAKDIADATADTRNANKIIEALQDQANDLAGKTNPYDRVPQKLLGRKGMNILTWANSRVKANMVLGNLGSTLGQLGNVPLGVGKAKQYAVPGLKDTLEQSVKELVKGDKTAPIYQSTFMKERFSDQLYRRFDQKLIEQPKKLAGWMLETGDKAGTRFIWNSMYNKGLKQKVTDPIKYADYETRNIIAGRGVGEVPLIQKSKSFQVLAPFTLEVGNQWRVLKDMVGEKDAAGILTFLIASYGMNKAVEQVRGSGVSFDPIDALVDGYTQGEGDTKDKALNSLASLNGEIVGNIPGGNLLTQFADTDKKIPMTDMQYKELFGERDPNRFGTGLTISKALQDPLYLLAPFGTAQFRKTTKGIDASKSEGVYKGDSTFIPFTGEKSELMYPVENNLKNNLQMGLFGNNATSEAKEYYKDDKRPLGEKQTAQYQTSKENGTSEVYYKSIMNKRAMDNIKDQIKEINKSQELTPEEKQAEIAVLMNELVKLIGN